MTPSAQLRNCTNTQRTIFIDNNKLILSKEGRVEREEVEGKERGKGERESREGKGGERVERERGGRGGKGRGGIIERER